MKLNIMELLKNHPDIDADERAKLLGVTDATEFELLSATYKEIFRMSKFNENHVMQGYARHKDTVFQCHDGGRCSTYRYSTGEKLGEFHFGAFYDHNHCGNAAFGLQYPDGNSAFPALYVSGDLTTKACYVESVTETGAELIQTVYFDIDPSYTGGQVIMDNERGRILYMQRENRGIGEATNVFRMCDFRIPALSEGAEVHFTNADIIESYTLPFYSPYYQGATLDGGVIYQTYGAFKRNLFDSKTGIMLFDAVTHDLLRIIQLDGIIDEEPQGIFIDGGRIIACFVEGGMYDITPVKKD